MEPQKSIVLPVVISIVITAVLVGGGAYYYGTMQATQPSPTPLVTQQATTKVTPIASSSSTPTPSSATVVPRVDTATWKDYIDTKGNILFKYPKDWTVQPYKGNDEGMGLSTLYLYPSSKNLSVTQYGTLVDGGGNKSQGSLMITVASTNKNITTLKDYYAQNTHIGQDYFKIAKSTQSLDISSRTWTEFDGLSDVYGDVRVFSLLQNNKVYEITDNMYDHPNDNVVFGVLQTVALSAYK